MTIKNKIILLPSLAFIFLICFYFGQTTLADTAPADQIPEPTILATTQVEEATNSQIEINGLVPHGNNILIYVNGNYDGMANISEIDNNISKFSYLSSAFSSDQPFEIMALAQNNASLKFSAPALASVNSVVLKTAIEPAPQNNQFFEPGKLAVLNSPRLLTPVGADCVVSPLISGTGPIGSSIYIYIDDSLATIIPVSSSSPSTLSFNYKPSGVLSRGSHVVYAIARDNQGSKSAKSNILNFCTIIPRITASSTAASTTDQKLATGEGAASNSPASLVFQKTLPNNYPNNSLRNTINLIVFAVFIAGLIAWMIIIGKDLARERSEAIETKTDSGNDDLPEKK